MIERGNAALIVFLEFISFATVTEPALAKSLGRDNRRREGKRWIPFSVKITDNSALTLLELTVRKLCAAGRCRPRRSWVTRRVVLIYL